jgi:hypothetical protein|tara:strand:- start:12 stop:266 length:255 start_codon:yes stop_codon:yes gene_type:complete
MKEFNKGFELYIGEKLSPEVISFLENTPLDAIERKAKDLEFKSWCPVAMQDDSKELRDALKQTSEMLFSFIRFQEMCEQINKAY